NVRTDIEVKLGAWSWDTDSGEEFRVGAGLADPYPLIWCAVEYFEITGTILRALLKKHSPNTPHRGRTLLHHAILCANSVAVNVLLDCGADIECPIKTASNNISCPLHMAVRLGLPTVLRSLLEAGCDINSRTSLGDTALMIAAKNKREECLRILATAGADFSLINNVGFSVSTIASKNKWSLGFQEEVLQVIKAGKVPQSSNLSRFSPLLFTTQAGDTEALKMVIAQAEIDVNQVDDNGFTAVLLAALKGHVECFRLLVYAKADVRRCTKSGETIITLSELSHTRDLIEKVLLEYALEMDNQNGEGFYALHCAARRGNLQVVQLLTSKGYDVNAPDGDWYTPLMLAAREGHASICKLLIGKGARCDVKNSRGETALSLARKNSKKENEAECIILDELARKLVCRGGFVQKHTKRGKGSPHGKMIKMVEATGTLTWGASRKRNVICREVEVGPSECFRKNRRGKSDVNEAGVFRIVTTKNKEVHFVCEGGCDVAKLWVRGIKLLTEQVVSGSNPKCI
ncbi:Ankyrin-3, partial [Bienertia sinuspersici]